MGGTDHGLVGVASGGGREERGRCPVCVTTVSNVTQSFGFVGGGASSSRRPIRPRTEAVLKSAALPLFVCLFW